MLAFKRIAFVIGVMGNGGAERVIANISNAMCEKDTEVAIFTVYGTRKDYDLDERILIKNILCKSKIKIFRPIERIKLLKKAIFEFAPDCVISFLADVNIYTLLATKGFSKPVIVSERNDPNQDPTQKWIRNLRDRIYKRADAAVFQTDDASAYFTNLLNKDSTKTVIPNPVAKNLPVRVYEQDGTKRFITACRLNAQKNLKMMIDAVEILKKEGLDLRLDIYGDGPLREELRAYIERKELTDHVCLKGFSKNIHEEMSKSYAFIISSDYEGISNSMLEALAIGMPVVATDCPIGGARMFIKTNENGILVPVGDTMKFADALKLILKDESFAESLGSEAQKIRELLDVDLITKHWIEFINVIILKGKVRK